MQISQIIEIMEFLKKEIGSRGIIESYENLVSLLNKISDKPEYSYSDEIAEAKKKISDLQSEAEPDNWTYSKYNLLKQVDKDCTFGIRAVEKLESIFNTNVASPSGIKKEIEKIISRLKLFLNMDSGTLGILSALSENGIYENDKSLLSLFFEGKTAITSLNDLGRYTKLWEGIINDFSILTRQEICEPVVEIIDKNVIVLSIESGDKILEALSYGAGKIIEAYNKILRIRKIQRESVEMDLNNAIHEFLEDEIINTIDRTSGNVVLELMEKNNWEGQRGKDEVFKSVHKSLKLILDFIEKGGKIECLVSDRNREIIERNKLLITAYDIVGQIDKITGEMALAN